MTLFPKLSNFRISPRPRRGLSRFGQRANAKILGGGINGKAGLG
jgi:hypothetical protein